MRFKSSFSSRIGPAPRLIRYLLLFSLLQTPLWIHAIETNVHTSQEKPTQKMTPDEEALNEKSISLNDWRWEYRVLLLDIREMGDDRTLIEYIESQWSEIRERRLQILLLDDSLHNGSISDNSLSTEYTDQNRLHLRQIKPFDEINKQQEHKASYSYDVQDVQVKLQGKKSVLIGLDGGVKSFYDWPSTKHSVDLKEVFADIDGMPMRRYELRNQDD